MMESGLVILLATLTGALLLDVLFGEYPNLLHPVVWIGTTTTLLLKIAPRRGRIRQFIFGLLLAICVPALFCVGAFALLWWLAEWPWLQVAVGIYLLKASLSLRELGNAAERVRAAVEAGDLPKAREALRSLCSRDPSELDEEALLGASIQSLGENASDSFVAPLFYFLLFGVPGAVAYRAINTLDAMVGYRGRFEYLGKASARLDDLVNWIPARLTAIFLLLAGWLVGGDVRGGWRILRRDAANTPSPNGGRPMATLAGLLGVKLEKKGSYSLGDPHAPLSPQAVRSAWRIIVVAGCLASTLVALGVVAMETLTPPGYRAVLPFLARSAFDQ